MSERQPNRNRKILRAAAGTLVAALATPALAACTGAPANPTPSAIATEDPNVKAQREQREAFLKKFDAIPAPVEVIADPLVVTSEAKQREEVLFAVDEDALSLVLADDNAAEINKAKRAIEKASNTDVRHDGRLYLDQTLAQAAVDAASGDIYVYEGSNGLTRNNAEMITAIRKQISRISGDKIQATATNLVNRELVDQALDDEDGKLNKTERALLDKVPKSLRAKAMQMLKDRSGKSFATFSAGVQSAEDALDADNSGFESLYDGAAYRAGEINKVMKAQLDDRREHSDDTKRPGAKDIAMGAVQFIDVDDARVQKDNLLAISDELSEVKQEALKAFDGELLDKIGGGS